LCGEKPFLFFVLGTFIGFVLDCFSLSRFNFSSICFEILKVTFVIDIAKSFVFLIVTN
jgi:hypothetical protein